MRRSETGSISAWAEEPCHRQADALAVGVDLRVGGGAFQPRAVMCRLWGRSPRGRRSLAPRACWPCKRGSISAWAEEPAWCRARDTCKGVDLRVGGGADKDGNGDLLSVGRSPRGRRSLKGIPVHVTTQGSISAWAEEPHVRRPGRSCHGVDLRVGGGAASASLMATVCAGRSPRGRRSRLGLVVIAGPLGSISAWAEEPPDQ